MSGAFEIAALELFALAAALPESTGKARREGLRIAP